VALCDFCFRDKTPLQPVFPRTPVNVCKACAYQIDRVIGFLRHSGITLVAQSEFTTEEKAPRPPKIPKPLGSKISPLNEKTQPSAPETG